MKLPKKTWLLLIVFLIPFGTFIAIFLAHKYLKKGEWKKIKKEISKLKKKL